MAYLLMVDDDEDFALAAATALQSSGHEVEVVLEPDKAVASIEQRRPDLILLDVMFPEDASAGFALARQIRHHEANLSNIPVLMLTAVNQRFPLGFSSKDIDEEWLPVTEFLEKPVDLDVLISRVNELLKKADTSA